MRGPEFRARAFRPASQSSFSAVLPPAPVPTTITSNVFAGKEVPLFRCAEVTMFRIVEMGTPGHFRPDRAQSWITENLQAHLAGVIANDGIVAHQLKEFASGL